jgi:hypothetical protein
VRGRPTDEYATGHFHLAARFIHAGDCPSGRHRRRDGSATPRDVAGQLRSGGFFWFDLQNPGDDELAEFCHSLLLSAGAIDSVTHASQRSSFSLAAGWVRAVRPAAVGTRPIAWLKAAWFAPASLEAAMSANCSLVYKFPVPDNRFPRTLRVIQRLDD